MNPVMKVKSIQRKPLSLMEKLEMIKKVDSSPNTSRAKIAENLGVPVSTLNNIMSKRAIITKQSLDASPLDRKKQKPGKYDKVEIVLLEWFRQKRALNLPLSGPIIREKAEDIARRLNVEFTASNGWIDRFKKRAGLVYKSVSGESKSVDGEIVDSWKTTALPSLLAQYKPQDIFNADECGLFFNLLPDKTYDFKGEKCHGGKRSKERITVLVCANMDGSEKWPLLVVGKAEKPRCFKNVRTIPCTYTNNSSAWMTCKIFHQYLLAMDRKMGAQNRKVILFLDQCAAHPKDVSHLKNVQVSYLPANTTSVLQPMDQGIIRSLKEHFRKKLVCRLLQRLTETSKTYKINILDAICFLCSSWNCVSQQTIANCFRKAGFLNSDVVAVDDNEAEDDFLDTTWRDLQEKMNLTTSFNDFVSVDQELLPCGVQNLEELCAETEGKSVGDDSEGETEPEEKTIPKCGEALKFLDGYRNYLSGVDNVPENIIKCLWELENYTQKNFCVKSNQKKIDDFFKK